MKFERTPRFDRDFAAMPAEHQRAFRAVVPAFHDACEAYIRSGGRVAWPSRLRVRRMTHAPGVWELTWSHSSPDGRATFGFVRRGDDVHLLWRRIGDHGIYRKP